MDELVTEKIKCVRFSLPSAEEIEKLAVVEITEPETIDNSRHVPNGLNDLRLGSTERGVRCFTCNYDGRLCPGHWGYINLAVPVYHLQFMKLLKHIFECVCLNCSNILIYDNDLKEYIKSIPKKKRINIIKKKSAKKCAHCGFIKPKFHNITSGDTKISYKITDPKTTKVKDVILLAEEAKMICERISDENVELLGMDCKHSRPERMIITKLLVAPPSVRPAMKRDDNQRAEDDLTVGYIMIIKENRKLKQRITQDPTDLNIVNLIENLTIAIALMFNSKVRASIKNPKMITGASKKQIKSIFERITSKAGRIRNNLQGKRVNNSGRTVIGGEPTNRLNQLLVPLKIAMNLTYPEVVTKYNKDRLYRLIANGSERYPGVKTYIDSNNPNYERRLDYISRGKGDISDIVLKEGDIVRRHLLDGDILLFNRQPSLHKLSMMGVEVRVMPHGNTFRFNVLATPPFNADFDGKLVCCQQEE